MVSQQKSISEIKCNTKEENCENIKIKQNKQKER